MIFAISIILLGYTLIVFGIGTLLGLFVGLRFSEED